MKTEMTREGVLVVTPENPIEGYALSKWCEDYKVISDGSGSSVLSIELKKYVKP